MTQKLESGVNAKHGLGILTAAIFISGEMVGSGILALPRAIIDAGWYGFLLLIIFGLNSCYCGVKLGQCWEILEERFPECRGISRNPYPDIGERAMGKWGRRSVTICNYFTLFGVATVYLLLASQMMHALLEDYVQELSVCVWILILAVVLTPPTWLGSPKDFWIVGVFALSTTLISCCLIFAQMAIDYNSKNNTVVHKQPALIDIFTSSGTILFSFGGASIFPSIQNDMRNRKKFKLSVTLAFIVILALYLPMTILAYVIYGEASEDNILLSLSPSPLVTCADILMTLHTIMAFLICINPVSLQTENILKIPHEFGFKRCLLRTGIVGLIVIVGETIPKFGKILALIGASTTTLSTFVFPNIFYIKLCNQQSDNAKRTVTIPIMLYLWLLILIGIVGGIAATYSSIVSMFGPDSFTKPCYWPD
ncbi:uncharacterized protein [Halyomorpha halys]|uniref:uncharacterized protein n=1 Tax=Halyomorpha halys TaxID=286706 RepID=UPI0006D4CD60|nr:amino acid transporter AVT1J-like [Halyomorpha halys]KAE8573193.1 hypothetical protein A483_HHAL012123 [Halyomorpha halys]